MLIGSMLSFRTSILDSEIACLLGLVRLQHDRNVNKKRLCFGLNSIEDARSRKWSANLHHGQTRDGFVSATLDRWDT